MPKGPAQVDIELRLVIEDHELASELEDRLDQAAGREFRRPAVEHQAPLIQREIAVARQTEGPRRGRIQAQQRD